MALTITELETEVRRLRMEVEFRESLAKGQFVEDNEHLEATEDTSW